MRWFPQDDRLWIFRVWHFLEKFVSKKLKDLSDEKMKDLMSEKMKNFSEEEKIFFVRDLHERTERLFTVSTISRREVFFAGS